MLTGLRNSSARFLLASRILRATSIVKLKVCSFFATFKKVAKYSTLAIAASISYCLTTHKGYSYETDALLPPLWFAVFVLNKLVRKFPFRVAKGIMHEIYL